MKEIANPGDGGIAMFIVELGDFLFDDFFCVRTALGIVIRLKFTGTCARNRQRICSIIYVTMT